MLLYIDPGSGSLLLQAILGVALGVGVFFKSIRYKLTQMFGKKDKQDADTPEEPRSVNDSTPH